MKKLLLLLLCVPLIFSCGKDKYEERISKLEKEIEDHIMIRKDVMIQMKQELDSIAYKPKLTTKSQFKGNEIFKSTCKSCHTIGGGRSTGSDLLGISKRRSENYIINVVQNPYNFDVPMPPADLDKDEIISILDYISSYNNVDFLRYQLQTKRYNDLSRMYENIIKLSRDQDWIIDTNGILRNGTNIPGIDSVINILDPYN